MGVGNYLAIRSHEGALAAQDRPEEEAHPARHGLATLLAFVVAGAVPLLPYVVDASESSRFVLSSTLTLAALFTVGAMRALVTIDRWWMAGLEMLLLGLLVAMAAYGSGALVAWIIGGGAAA
jgi:VIT1/CCC1 family predicted Fe2+/Mn2+ transporter